MQRTAFINICLCRNHWIPLFHALLHKNGFRCIPVGVFGDVKVKEKVNQRVQAIQHAQIVLPRLCLFLPLQKKFDGFVDVSVPLVQRAQHGCHPLLARSVLALFGLRHRLLAPVDHLFPVVGIAVKHGRSISIIAEITFGRSLIKGQG